MTTATTAAAPRRLPDPSRITLAGVPASDLAAATKQIAVSWQVESAAQLGVDVLDPAGALSRHGLLVLGTRLGWTGSTWVVGSVGRGYRSWGRAVHVDARSAVVRTLRTRYATRADKQVTPAAWIAPRVAAAGGKAVVQPSPTHAVITQERGQSELDVITSVLSDSGMTWTEHDGVLYAGTPWWAYTGGPGLPVWPATWQQDPATDVLSLDTALTDDDKEQTGTATLVLTQAAGLRVRPWHRLALSGCGGDDDGLWLVRDVAATVDGVSPVTVQAHRPRKTAPTAGSAATPTATTGDSRAGGADTRGASERRKKVVAYALAQVGKQYSYAAHPPRTWDCSKLTAWAWRQGGLHLTAYTYDQAKQCDRIDESQLLPGDLVFYFRSAHHVAMYIGGGRIVEASSPRYDVRTTDLHHSWGDAHVSFYARPRGADDGDDADDGDG